MCVLSLNNEPVHEISNNVHARIQEFSSGGSRSV